MNVTDHFYNSVISIFREYVNSLKRDSGNGCPPGKLDNIQWIYNEIERQTKRQIAVVCPYIGHTRTYGPAFHRGAEEY